MSLGSLHFAETRTPIRERRVVPLLDFAVTDLTVLSRDRGHCHTQHYSPDSDSDTFLPNGTEIGLTNDDADGSAGTTRVGVSSDANQLRDGVA